MSVEREKRFERLYARHAPAVKGYLLRRCDAASAEDALAEVFIVAWRRFDELPSDSLPWLLGAARRVLSTQRRSERRRAALEDRLAEAAPPLEVPPVATDTPLAGALARLGERDRELLLLVAWEGLSPGQAAAALGVKPSTARVRLMRARRRLSDALAREQSCAASAPVTMEVSP